MKYQERVSTIGDIRALYEKVIADPTIEQYRGYTTTKSYGWDEDVGDYVKANGERWFYNPAYEPACDTDTNLEQTVGEFIKRVLKKAKETGYYSVIKSIMKTVAEEMKEEKGLE